MGWRVSKSGTETSHLDLHPRPERKPAHCKPAAISPNMDASRARRSAESSIFLPPVAYTLPRLRCRARSTRLRRHGRSEGSISRTARGGCARDTSIRGGRDICVQMDGQTALRGFSRTRVQMTFMRWSKQQGKRGSVAEGEGCCNAAMHHGDSRVEQDSCNLNTIMMTDGAT